MDLDIESDESPDFAQLMLMSDGDSEDCFRGAMLLIVKEGKRDWRWYDAELFDDLDHMKRFIDKWLRSKYSIETYMMMLCRVENSGLVDTADPESN